MSHLQSLHLEHLPESYTLHVALFHSVINASFLHQQLLAGNSDFEYAFIDASIIVSRLHALAAAFRATNDLIEGRLRSRNVHSEVVFALSPNNNIADSFRRFGITPTTTSLLVLKVSMPSSQISSSAVSEHLQKVVQGIQVPFDDETIAKLTDWNKVKKVYKLNAATRSGSAGGKSGNGTMNWENDGAEGDWERELEIQILGAMALKGAS